MSIKESINYILGMSFGFQIAKIPMLRPSAKYLKDNFKGPFVIAEVGVDAGINSYHLLKNLNVKHIYLIDVWNKYDEILKLENRTSEGMSAAYQSTVKLTKPWEKKVDILINRSVDAAKEIPDELDYVYIDASHEYEYVKEDIEVYYNKVRKGGILAGHDINRSGVCRAVVEFVNAHDLTLMTSKYDWWIVK